MNPIFEKYLLGEMGADESERFERELAENAAFREEFERERDFFETLKNQMLRRKIENALSESDNTTTPQAPRRIYPYWRQAMIVILILIAWAIYLRSYKAGRTESDLPLPPDQIQSQPTKSADSAPYPHQMPPQKTIKSTPPPIAQHIQPHSLESLRGDQNATSEWAILVKKIWYAPLPESTESFGADFKPITTMSANQDFTGAYLALRRLEKSKPENDTLIFLKGYCLMQLWEGGAALRQFELLSKKTDAWHIDVEWYNALCYLVTGQKQKAISAFENTTRSNSNRYRTQAQRALKLLR